MAKVKNTLKPEQYWEWRTTISEMDVAREKYLRHETELKLFSKDIELLAAKQQLFVKSKIETAKLELDRSKSEYEATKKKLEEYLGQSLNNKAINDVTFEVREMPDEQPILPKKA